MNINYELKYIKYKNKYYSLKNKFLMKKLNNQIGGANRIIVFACTSLKPGTTFDRYFDLLISTINKYIPIENIKDTYFIDTAINTTYKQELIQKMTKHNYNIENIKNEKQILIEYIKENFLQQNIKIDVLVLSECNDFISSFTTAAFFVKYYNFFKKNRDKDKELFDIVKANLYLLYDSVNGYIINIYYNKGGFTNIVFFMSPVTISYLLLHFIFCNIFNQLFAIIEEGIYKKNDGISQKDYDGICEYEFNRAADAYYRILDDPDIPVEEKRINISRLFNLDIYFTFIKNNKSVDDSYIQKEILNRLA
jgi:hypothetical protein